MPNFDANEDLARLPAVGRVGLPDVAAAVGRHLDVVLVIVAAVAALALGAPVFGVVVGAVAWLLQRAIGAVNRTLIDRKVKPGSRLGPDFIEAFARIWLLAGAIVLAGAVGHREDGLAAALMIAFGYSVAFAVRIHRGRPAGGAEG
jgi:hypothetical protein